MYQTLTRSLYKLFLQKSHIKLVKNPTVVGSVIVSNDFHIAMLIFTVKIVSLILFVYFWL